MNTTFRGHAPNTHVFLCGQPGSGKTTLARLLARRAWRVLIFDPVLDYDDVTVGRQCTTVYDVDGALTWLDARRREPGCLIYRPLGDEIDQDEYSFVLRGAIAVQQEESPGADPLAIVVDEATLVSDTYDLHPTVRRLLNMGRRWRIGLVIVSQVDTDIHRLVRRNAAAIVALKQTAISTDLRRFFGASTATLHTLRPGVTPARYTHYLSYPDLDIVAWWRENMGRPAPARE